MALGFPDGDTLGHNDVMVQGKTLWCHVEKRHAFSRTTQGILNTRKGVPFLYVCSCWRIGMPVGYLCDKPNQARWSSFVF